MSDHQCAKVYYADNDLRARQTISQINSNSSAATYIVNCCYQRIHFIVWQDMSTLHWLEYRNLQLEICATGILSKPFNDQITFFCN